MKNRDIIEKVIFNLLNDNIKLNSNERILIFTDRTNNCETNQSSNLFDIALLFSEIAKNISKSVTFINYKSTCGHGIEPPENVWIETFGEDVVFQLKKKGYFKKILDKTLNEDKIESVENILEKYSVNVPNVIIALSYFSTSHTQYRKLLTKICKTRYCSMPLFEKSMFFTSLQEDWTLLRKRTIFLKEKLRNASYVTIKSKNGTFLRFSVTGREFFTDTGDLSKPGAFSNIPAGEVFIAPRENTANGKLVIEYSPVKRLREHLTFWIEDGVVTYIEGNDNYKKELEKKLEANDNNRNIAEFGIGTNSSATNMLNILEAEKILGTIHIALGDNSSFGGNVKTNFHEDYILEKPTVEVFTSQKESFFILVNGEPLF